MGSTPSTCWSWAGSKSCCKQRPTIARPARSSRGLYRRADEGIGPYGNAESHRPCCRGGRPRPPAGTRSPRPPRQRVAKRNARKEKLVKCVLAPRRPPHHPPRDGSIDLAEDPSVPEGQAKSEQAPIRRPPSRAEGHCTGARLAPFSLPPGAAHSLFGQDQKENGGRIPRGNGPLREQNPPGGRLPPLRRLPGADFSKSV